MTKDIVIPAKLCEFTDMLKNAGHATYFVGGCVRDLLLGKAVVDYDVASSATPERVMELFSDCKVIPTGIKHGTVTVLYGAYSVELTTFRKDGEYPDCRHPVTVEFSNNVYDDTKRRDFTINALCYDTVEGLLDYHNGLDDLKNGIIRCVGVPDKRFGEDSLRILRALRFASRLGFSIEKVTHAAMLRCKHLIQHVSAERVLSELKGFFNTEPSWSYIEPFFGVFKSACHISLDVNVGEIQSILRLIVPSNRLCVFFALCGGSLDGAVELINKLKPDKATTKDVIAAATACYCDCFSDVIECALTVRRFGIDTTKMMYELSLACGKTVALGTHKRIMLIEEGAFPGSLKELAVNGNDLLEMGIKGADVGNVLEHLFISVHNGTENEKSVLLTETTRYFNERNN